MVALKRKRKHFVGINKHGVMYVISNQEIKWWLSSGSNKPNREDTFRPIRANFKSRTFERILSGKYLTTSIPVSDAKQ